MHFKQYKMGKTKRKSTEGYVKFSESALRLHAHSSKSRGLNSEVWDKFPEAAFRDANISTLKATVTGHSLLRNQ